MYQIKYIGNPVLRKKSEIVEHFDEKFDEFLDEMTRIMYEKDGIGLAAPQIGVLKQVVVIDVSELVESEDLRIFINPQIHQSSGESVVEEGCLSIPNVKEDVSRPDKISLSYQDETGKQFTGEFDGWLARVLQHEIDHLNGVLFVDYLSPLKQKLLISQNTIPEKY